MCTGAVLCHPQFPVPLVTKLEARVVVLDVAVPLLQGQQVSSLISSMCLALIAM